MKKKWKVVLGVLLFLVVVVGVIASIRINQRGIVTVQTGRTVRQDVTSLVTASGEIKPRNYINIGANAQGIITALLVKEGDHVRKNQVVARIEAIQAQADVQGQQASLNAALADSAAAEAGVKAMDDAVRTNEATVERAKADLEKAKVDFDRGARLLKDKLVAKQDYDQRKAAYDAAVAGLQEAKARLDQVKAQRAQTAAQLSSSQRKVAQTRAMLARVSDVLAKHDAVAPLDGVVDQPPGACRRDGCSWNPEFVRQYDHDDCGYVADHRGSEGG